MVHETFIRHVVGPCGRDLRPVAHRVRSLPANDIMAYSRASHSALAHIVVLQFARVDCTWDATRIAPSIALRSDDGVSRRRFDALSDTQRELLQRLARESVSEMRRLWDEGEAAARTAVLASGVQINEVDAAAFARAVEPLLREELRDSEVQRLHRAIRSLA